MAEQLNTNTPEQQEEPAIQSVMSAQPKTLSVADVKSKIDTQTPLYSHEFVPDVPENRSAKGFYGQFKDYGGASVYSQKPFASSLDQIQKTAYLPEQPSFVQSPTQPQQIVDEPLPEQAPLETFEPTSGSGDVSTITPEYSAYSLSSFFPEINTEKNFFENITEKYHEFREYTDTEFGSVFRKDLSDISENISNSFNEGTNQLQQSIQDAYKTLEPYVSDPSKAVSDVSEKLIDSFQELERNLSDLTNPDTHYKALDYFGGIFKDTLVSQLFTQGAVQLGFGAMSGVAGLIASTIFSEGDDPRIGDIGTINVGYNDPRSLLGMTFNEVSKLAEANDDRIVQVSHFNSDGIAVDKNNRVVSTLSGPNVVQTSSVMVNSVKGWHLAATLSPEELQTRADITAARDKDDIFSTPFMDSYDEVGGWLGDADDDEEDKEVDVDDEEAANFTDFMSQEQAGDDADSGAAGDQEGGGFAEGPGGYSGYW